MTVKYLWITGSSIFLVLGTIHLYYTFFTSKFSVRDPATGEQMKKTFPVITRKTTMWKAWIGFNASHSIGAMYFGGINLLLAALYFEWLKHQCILPLLTSLVSLFYLFLGIKYWFGIPRAGTMVASICFVAGTTILLLK